MALDCDAACHTFNNENVTLSREQVAQAMELFG